MLTLAPHDSDFVHARAPGQVTMAYVILKTLHAPAEVSDAVINAHDGRAVTRNCAVREFQRLKAGPGIAFVRADAASPCWLITWRMKDCSEPLNGAAVVPTPDCGENVSEAPLRAS